MTGVVLAGGDAMPAAQVILATDAPAAARQPAERTRLQAQSVPALMQPAAPSMTGPGPGGGPAALRIGSALLGGVGTYMNSAAGIKKAAEPNGGTIPTVGIG